MTISIEPVVMSDGDVVLFVDEITNEGEDFSGWFCIKTDPWECPRCDYVAEYVTAMHIIIVWPEKDDPQMLDAAKYCMKHKRNPKIVEYEVAFGEAMSYYAWAAMGRPAHTQP